jgi:hypothetical protein
MRSCYRCYWYAFTARRDAESFPSVKIIKFVKIIVLVVEL